jgi:hypothetical protein
MLDWMLTADGGTKEEGGSEGGLKRGTVRGEGQHARCRPVSGRVGISIALRRVKQSADADLSHWIGRHQRSTGFLTDFRKGKSRRPPLRLL